MSLTESFMGNTFPCLLCSFCTLTFGVFDSGFASKDATSLHSNEKNPLCGYTRHCSMCILLLVGFREVFCSTVCYVTRHKLTQAIRCFCPSTKRRASTIVVFCLIELGIFKNTDLPLGSNQKYGKTNKFMNKF